MLCSVVMATITARISHAQNGVFVNHNSEKETQRRILLQNKARACRMQMKTSPLFLGRVQTLRKKTQFLVETRERVL
jgi:hypothetical protein